MNTIQKPIFGNYKSGLTGIDRVEDLGVSMQRIGNISALI